MQFLTYRYFTKHYNLVCKNSFFAIFLKFVRETSSNFNLTPFPPKLGMTKAMQSVSSIQNYLKVDIVIVVIRFGTGIFTSFKKNLLVPAKTNEIICFTQDCNILVL